MNLKAKLNSSSSDFNFKCLVPGAFNMGLIGSTCTALPSGKKVSHFGWAVMRPKALAVAAQLQFESKV